jgi:hypothetical protein
MNKTFLVKVRYHQKDERGLVKTVTDKYLAKAVNYTDVEALVADQLGSTTEGGVAVASITPFKMNEFIADPMCNDLYKVTIELLYEDADSGKVKVVKDIAMVFAESTHDAEEKVGRKYAESLVRFEVIKTERTDIVDLLDSENTEDDEEESTQEESSDSEE